MKMQITFEQLLARQPGCVFYEDDPPEPVLWRKLGNSQDGRDVKVRGIATSDECRLGLAEMSDVERNSKRWHVCDAREIERMIKDLTEAAFQSPGVIDSATIEEWSKDPTVQGAVGRKSRWT
jgi:hypothetical protein